MNEQQVAQLVKALALLNGYLGAAEGAYELGKLLVGLLKGLGGGFPEKTREEALAAIAGFELAVNAAAAKNAAWLASHQG